MKLLFRRKSDGHILKPIQTLDSYVRLRHVHSDRVFRAPKVTLPQFFEVLTHDIERGDVLRDVRDGQLWVVECAGFNNLRIQTRMGGVSGNMIRGMTYFELIHYERVGRKYRLRESQPAYATYDATQVQSKIRHATREIVNRFDAVTNAQRHAQEYGVGFIRVEPDGSMNAIDPRSVILK